MFEALTKFMQAIAGAALAAGQHTIALVVGCGNGTLRVIRRSGEAVTDCMLSSVNAAAKCPRKTGVALHSCLMGLVQCLPQPEDERGGPARGRLSRG